MLLLCWSFCGRRAVTVLQFLLTLWAATRDIPCAACECLERKPVEDELFEGQLPIKSVSMPAKWQS